MSYQALTPARAGLVALLLALVTVLVAVVAAGSAQSLRAQAAPEVTNGAVGINFPTNLLFSAIVDASQEVTEASLLYQIPPEGALTRIPAEVTAGEILRVDATVDTNAGDQYIPPVLTSSSVAAHARGWHHFRERSPNLSLRGPPLRLAGHRE